MPSYSLARLTKLLKPPSSAAGTPLGAGFCYGFLRYSRTIDMPVHMRRYSRTCGIGPNMEAGFIQAQLPRNFLDRPDHGNK